MGIPLSILPNIILLKIILTDILIVFMYHMSKNPYINKLITLPQNEDDCAN